MSLAKVSLRSFIATRLSIVISEYYLYSLYLILQFIQYISVFTLLVIAAHVFFGADIFQLYRLLIYLSEQQLVNILGILTYEDQYEESIQSVLKLFNLYQNGRHLKKVDTLIVQISFQKSVQQSPLLLTQQFYFLCSWKPTWSACKPRKKASEASYREQNLTSTVGNQRVKQGTDSVNGHCEGCGLCYK